MLQYMFFLFLIIYYINISWIDFLFHDITLKGIYRPGICSLYFVLETAAIYQLIEVTADPQKFYVQV